MFYYLSFLQEHFSGFNIFRYITIRAAFASISSFLLCLWLTRKLIGFLSVRKIGDIIRDKKDFALHDDFKHKRETPGMGGIAVILSVVVSSLLWADMSNGYVRLILLAIIYLGFVGFLDDYLKFSRKNSKGLRPKLKFIAQVILGLALGIIFYLDPSIDHHLEIPFLKSIFIDLGILYILFSAVVIVGSSNAVNLTDGLDGLAIGCIIMAALAYTGMCYVAGHAVLSRYLMISFIPGAGELTIFCASLVGAGLGFLWYNCYPASIFMGDTGALALGGIIGIISLMIKKELLLVVVGGIFVAEAFSVIIQVFSFRLRKKRVFLMSPLHHHFQMKGMRESKVVVRFWIFAAIFALLSLATLKIR